MITKPRLGTLNETRNGEPVYRVAELLPPQGEWSIDLFLRLNDDEGLLELVNGRLESPPVPTQRHQDVQEHLYEAIRNHARQRNASKTNSAGIRVRLPNGNIREPDVVFMRASNAHRRHNEYWEGADLVVEVVSSDDPKRDLVEKKAEYASAGIPEYWIADPRDKMLTIFTLDDGATEYREAGRYQEGETAKSLLLAGLTVDVTAVFTGE
ncbi:MAG: Uma2 family endonuclease [Planctomycetaceae bacterium]|nr:Uma2 family endonuclease [Planctomycetaceae bacterium]